MAQYGSHTAVAQTVPPYQAPFSSALAHPTPHQPQAHHRRKPSVRRARDSNELRRSHERKGSLERPSLDPIARARSSTMNHIVAEKSPSHKATRSLPHTTLGPSAMPSSLTPRPVSTQHRENHNGSPANPPPTATLLKPPDANVPSTSTPAGPPTNATSNRPRKSHRSYSCSILSDRENHSQPYFHGHRIPGDQVDPPQRSKSVADVRPDGLLDLEIPHYRLGVPRFTDQGNAYLHYSILSVSSDGRSSTIWRPDRDTLVPPRAHHDGFKPISWSSSVQNFFHPHQPVSRRATGGGTSNVSRILPTADFFATMFDKIEKNPHDPSFVRYHRHSGRAVAVTPIRLIALITSPQFLDYQLLADFFLTYRCFMPRGDVLEYLFARMRWALGSSCDAGRIARVRTFVALRHWILNYFSDDFLPDLPFRQRFCDAANDIADSLRQRPDHGGGDINIIGELKKCWRRTCAVYWPAPGALDDSPDVDIDPGGDLTPKPLLTPAMSLPLTIRPTTRSESIFEVAQASLPNFQTNAEGAIVAVPNGMAYSDELPPGFRKVSIPASPLTEESEEVLSCSVPFLRQARLPPDGSAPAPPSPVREKHALPGDTIRKSTNNEKRSGSISDALRDPRGPLSSTKVNSFDGDALPVFALTGGLVRGILLQPSPARLDIPIPSSPHLGAKDAGKSAFNHTADLKRRNPSVKKIARGMRRAFSVRNQQNRSPVRSHKSNSSTDSSRGEVPVTAEPKSPIIWNRHGAAPRQDILAARIETAYNRVFPNASVSHAEPERSHQTAEAAPFIRPDRSTLHLPTGDVARLHSHITTGSRSILIVDATGAPDLPTPQFMPSGLSVKRAEPDSQLFTPEDFADLTDLVPEEEQDAATPRHEEDVQEKRHGQSFEEQRLGDLLAIPNDWILHGNESEVEESKNLKARKSSGAHPDALDLLPIRQHQLRRRPGGDDLKTADHVQDLEYPTPHPASSNSWSLAVSGEDPSDRHSQEVVMSGFTEMQSSGPQSPPILQSTDEAAFSLVNPDRSWSDVRPSFEPQVNVLKSVPDDPPRGGIEDTLMKLEGRVPSPSDSVIADPRQIFGSDVDVSSQNGEEQIGAALTLNDHPRENALIGGFGDDAEADGENGNDGAAMPQGEFSPDVPHEHVEVPQQPNTLPDRQHLTIQPPEGLDRVSTTSVPQMTARISRFPFADPFTPIETPISPPGGDKTPRVEYFGQSQRSHPANFTPVEYLDQGRKHPPADFTHEEYPGKSEEHSQASSDRIEYSGENEGRPSTASVETEDFNEDEKMLPTNIGHRRGPSAQTSHASFFLDDNESLSNVSTSIVDPIHPSEEDSGVRTFFLDDAIEDESMARTAVRPAEATTPIGQSRTKSSSVMQLNQQTPPPQPREESTVEKRPLEETSANAQTPAPARPPQITSPRLLLQRSISVSHMAFILAFESEVVAEQMTIIEKDVLDEVDWKDLISLNWQHNPPQVRNWVEYITRGLPNGVDMVIARFNLVVKWIVSEILLTDEAGERARTIDKYIHIASHAHRLRNYATVYQITLALLSSDLVRLHRTWSLVGLGEKRMLKQFDTLCQPMRNFHNLRAEMEVPVCPEAGCIPFIGLYTHDLRVNSNRSFRIEPSMPGPDPLVPFERYQTAAAIVKNLLRHVESSSKYRFRPRPEALSRCLWIAALDVGEIAAREKLLEMEESRAPQPTR